MAHKTGRSKESMGRRLASLRALRGWTQAEAAEKAGITQAYLSQLENDGALRPPLLTIAKLAEVYQTSLDYLAFGGEIARVSA